MYFATSKCLEYNQLYSKSIHYNSYDLKNLKVNMKMRSFTAHFLCSDVQIHHALLVRYPFHQHLQASSLPLRGLCSPLCFGGLLAWRC